MATMPTLFVNHGGGPMPLMGDAAHAPLVDYLRGAAAGLPARPAAVLVVTAHWEARRTTVSSAARPEMIFDYGGFPPETYHYTYDAPGDAGVAAAAVELLRAAGLDAGLDEARGFDHGVFVPLMLLFPAADVPVVSLSLAASLDPVHHLAVGLALGPLREQGVLIVGSGMSYHNMRTLMAARRGNRRGFLEWKLHGADFDGFLRESCVAHSGAARTRALAGWGSHPEGRAAHPREEHLLPLLVAAGAGAEDAGRVAFEGALMGAAVTGFQFG
jgi:aromatic ring-opening dioxygenase catalytic subunit (LigB family)